MGVLVSSLSELAEDLHIQPPLKLIRADVKVLQPWKADEIHICEIVAPHFQASKFRHPFYCNIPLQLIVMGIQLLQPRKVAQAWNLKYFVSGDAYFEKSRCLLKAQNPSQSAVIQAKLKMQELVVRLVGLW